MKPDKIFADGIYLNKVKDTAPEWILCDVSIHIDKAIAWLETMRPEANDKGYINLTGKESAAGKRYFELNTWKPTTPTNSPSALPTYPTPDSEIRPEDIPF